MELNYPYCVYPGYPFCGYTDTVEYNKNLTIIFNLLKTLNEKNKLNTLFHLTIGACMEEYFKICSEKELNQFGFHWMQLFPHHLKAHALAGGKVINVIISPTESFKDENWIEPTFVKHTPEFCWDTSDHSCIKSTKYDVIVYIFCTMMPSIDKKNQQKIQILNSTMSNDKNIATYVKHITQTVKDIEFVQDFYYRLQTLKEQILNTGGIFTCFSFAVFEITTQKKKYNNFSMFYEITSLFSKYSQNSLLAEWFFTLGSYTLTEFGSNNNNISFTSEHDDYILGLNVSVLKTNNNLILEKQKNKKSSL